MKHVAQKARREAKAKVKKKAKKQRLAEEKKKKKWLEYLQQLQNKMLVKDATLLEGTERSQVVESKHKEVASGDKKR